MSLVPCALCFVVCVLWFRAGAFCRFCALPRSHITSVKGEGNGCSGENVVKEGVV